MQKFFHIQSNNSGASFYSVNTTQNAIISKRAIVNLIIILSCFPFLALMPGIVAEVQPYCYVFCLVFIFVFKQKLPFNYYIYFLFVAIYFLKYLFGIGYTNFVFSAIPHLIIFLGPPLYFYLSYKYFNEVNLKIITTVFYIYVAVGFIQYFFPPFFIYTGLKPILEQLIPRFQINRMEEFGNRGVTSLANEPSSAAMVYFATFLVTTYRFFKHQISKREFRVCLFLYLISVYFNSSLTCFMLSFILLIAYVIHSKKIWQATLISAVIVLPFIFFDTGFRIAEMASVLPDLLESVNWSLYDLFVGPLGSMREFSSWVGIKSSFFYPFGNGYYSSFSAFIDVAKDIGVDISKVTYFTYEIGGYINMKPTGFSSLILFEIGVIPFLLVNYVVWFSFYKCYKKKGSFAYFGITIFVLSWLLLNFDSLSSLPCLWLSLIVSLQIIKLNKWSAGSANAKI